MPLPLPGNDYKYVVVIVFYSAETVPFSLSNVAAYAIQKYEDARGMSKHRHVGISLGRLGRNKRLQIIPYDFSCWNGRESGATFISPIVFDQAQAEGMNILAHDALLFELDSFTYESLISNLLYVPTGPDATNRCLRSKPKDMPINHMKYPGISMIFRDFVASCFLRRWNMAELEERLNTSTDVAQCSQYVLFLVIYCMQSDFFETTPKNKHDIYSLVFSGTALHPHTLWTVLSSMAFCQKVGQNDKIVLSEHIVSLKKLWLQSPGIVSNVPVGKIWEFFHTPCL
jgi:hypothetical protein